MNISIKALARIGGLLYLINIVFGFFAVGYVPGVINVSGNASASAHNIILHENIYRLALVAHITILITNIPLAVIFYNLFKVVNRRISLLVVLFTMVGTSIEAANLLSPFASLVLLKGKYYSDTFTSEQLSSLSYIFQQLEGIGFNISLVFFGFYCLSIGYLIFKSTFLPSLVGILMAIGGACYLVNSFANFLSPSTAGKLFPFIQLPSGLAELSFTLTLLIMGVNKQKWLLKQSLDV